MWIGKQAAWSVHPGVVGCLPIVLGERPGAYLLSYASKLGLLTKRGSLGLMNAARVAWLGPWR